jgi:hypothetical protein
MFTITTRANAVLSREITVAIFSALAAVCAVAGLLVWMKFGRPGRKAGKGSLDYALMGGGDETL